jgi:hypothetical protein
LNAVRARQAKPSLTALLVTVFCLQENDMTPYGHSETNVSLQNAVRKLLAVWREIEDEICAEFNDIEQHVGGGYVVQIDTFEVITAYCLRLENKI